MPAQEQPEPDGIIERVENAHKDDKILVGYKKDPNYKENPKFKFYIYKLRIEEIFELLSGDKKLRTLPIDSLKEYESGLDEISGKFYKLYGEPGLGALQPEPIQDFIDEAGTQLSTAIDYLGDEGKREKDMEKYLRHLKNCRRQLFFLKDHLDAVCLALNIKTEP